MFKKGVFMKIAKNITELIGNTPLVRLNTISDETGCEVYGKCEFMNPTSSVKDRLGCAMIMGALERGEITKESVIIEPTSGNTGIALASLCASLGIRLILTMPSSMSIERRKVLAAFGAQLELTPAEKGMKGAVDHALELERSIPNGKVLQQFENQDNARIHRETTALEIWNDTDGKIDIFVAAVGTGGTLTGTTQILKEKNPTLISIAVEPDASPVLSGGSAAPHRIQGIGAGFVPKVLDVTVFDEVVRVTNDEAFEMSRTLALTEGLLVGISAGANAHAARLIAARPENKGKTIVTILCDTGERYLSTDLFGEG